MVQRDSAESGMKLGRPVIGEYSLGLWDMKPSERRAELHACPQLKPDYCTRLPSARYATENSTISVSLL